VATAGVALTAETGRALAANAPLVFAPTSGYGYPAACESPAAVVFLQTNGGTPPAQVRWASGHTFWVQWADLALPGAPLAKGADPCGPAPPQGWLLLRPAGPGTPAVARQTSSSRPGGLRCYGCGHGLQPPASAPAGTRHGFAPGTAATLTVGQAVLVAATLEPATVVAFVDAADDLAVGPDAGYASGSGGGGGPISSAAKEAAPKNARAELDQRAVVEFPGGDDDGDGEKARFSFECAALLVPGVAAEDMIVVSGRPRSRRECWLLHQGDAGRARAAWAAAKPWAAPGSALSAGSGGDFASCVRGHLLHARCFQGALLSGQGCPACAEPLFVPRVERTDRADDDCHALAAGADAGGSGGFGEAAALDAAQAVESEAVTNGAPSASGGGGAPLRSLGGKQLRMCPSCCAGPLLNENCSDMRVRCDASPPCTDRCARV